MHTQHTIKEEIKRKIKEKLIPTLRRSKGWWRLRATMESKIFLLRILLFFFVVGLASSSHISIEVLEPHASLGRSLLQQKADCPVDFENMNYTVITSQCKGPNYTPQRCCEPLKELLCPVKDQVNDLKSTCADTFFSYVNLYGKYPPGLFASLCREGQNGLECPAPTPTKSGAVGGSRSSALVMILAGLVVAAMFNI